MNKIKHLFLLIFAVVLFIACENNTPAPYPVPQQQADKTLFVYMPWSASRTSNYGSLYNAFQQNLRDMKAGIVADGGLHRNRLMVFISTSATTAVMMEITYDNGICRQDTLERYTAANIPAFTTPDGIAHILNKVKYKAPAQTYAMLIGCHGTGWLFANGASRAKTRYFGGSDSYFQTNIPTLAQGISRAGMQMQYIMFDDCYMSNIEVAYELRHVTDYLIGCCSEIMAYGMPYQKMWHYLTQLSPDYGKIVDEFHHFYSNYSTPCGNIGITNCNRTEEMAQVMRAINTTNTFNLADTTNVQKLDGYRNTIFYDMGAYVSRLCTDPTLYTTFQSVLNRLTPFKSTTPDIYTSLGQLPYNRINVNTFSGITISDPTVSNFERAIITKTQTGWWKATH